MVERSQTDVPVILSNVCRVFIFVFFLFIMFCFVYSTVRKPLCFMNKNGLETVTLAGVSFLFFCLLNVLLVMSADSQRRWRSAPPRRRRTLLPFDPPPNRRSKSWRVSVLNSWWVKVDLFPLRPFSWRRSSDPRFKAEPCLCLNPNLTSERYYFIACENRAGTVCTF